MDYQTSLQIYQAQTNNKRLLDKAEVQIRRSINESILQNDRMRIEIFTRLYTLTYCAWVETRLSFLIHTPHGFGLEEISQIKTQGSFKDKWKKCLELSFKKLDGVKGFLSG